MPYASPRVRAERQRRGIKPADFAAQVGLSYGHLHNVEGGTAPASIEALHRIADALALAYEEVIDQ